MLKKFLFKSINLLVFFIAITTIWFSSSIQPVFAHEAYVLTRGEFQQGLASTTKYPLVPLLDPAYITTTGIVAILVIISYLLVILWSTTKWASLLDLAIKKAKVIGPITIRLAISASFFYAALANSILGPELSLTLIPGGLFIRVLLFALSIMIFFGFFTEIAALIGLIIFFYVSSVFQWYMVTYANYFGELIVLFLFGSRFLSLDKYLFGKNAWNRALQKYRELEIPIVRMLYGVGLMYAGLTIKFTHQSLSIDVYNQYHLANFFHASASFIASGAGLCEILIGLFILIGFMQRFTVLISLCFITLSIFYFREMLWPHFMLYGISFSLLINSADKFTIDRYLIPFARKIVQKKATKKKK